MLSNKALKILSHLIDKDWWLTSGIFKPPKTLAEFLNTKNIPLSRDYYSLDQRNDANPHDEPFRRLLFNNYKGKNVIALRMRCIGGYWSWRKHVLQVGIVPGRLNQEGDFSHDIRDGRGSSFIIINYVIECDKDIAKEIETEFRTDNKFLQQILQKLLSKAKLSHRKIFFELNPYFRLFEGYEFVMD